MIAKIQRGVVRRAALDSTHEFDRTDDTIPTMRSGAGAGGSSPRPVQAR